MYRTLVACVSVCSCVWLAPAFVVRLLIRFLSAVPFPSLYLARSALHHSAHTQPVLVARGRAQVGVAAATTDWPKRIRDMRYADQNDRGTAD